MGTTVMTNEGALYLLNVLFGNLSKPNNFEVVLKGNLNLEINDPGVTPLVSWCLSKWATGMQEADFRVKVPYFFSGAPVGLYKTTSCNFMASVTNNTVSLSVNPTVTNPGASLPNVPSSELASLTVSMSNYVLQRNVSGTWVDTGAYQDNGVTVSFYGANDTSVKSLTPKIVYQSELFTSSMANDVKYDLNNTKRNISLSSVITINGMPVSYFTDITLNMTSYKNFINSGSYINGYMLYANGTKIFEYDWETQIELIRGAETFIFTPAFSIAN